ncbi:MAG: hypothetical protein ACFFKA_01450 [Candidatus Thorarchaeota archaeon]
MSSSNMNERIFVGNPNQTLSQQEFLLSKIEVFPGIASYHVNHKPILNQSYQKAFEIHQILQNNNELSNDQKLEICRLGRYFMKQYLKDIISHRQI